MSDGAISQDEIDALLSGVDMGSLGGTGSSSASSQQMLQDSEKQVLQTFVDDTVASLKSNLDLMTGESFEIGTPVIETLNRDQFLKKLPEMVVGVLADFSAGFTGDHLFVLTPEFAQKLAGLINKEENVELDDMSMSVVSEVISQHTGTEITSLSQTKKVTGLATVPPEASHVPKAMVRFPMQTFVLFTFPVSVSGGAYSLWEVVSMQVAKDMIRVLGGEPEPASGGALSAADMQAMTGFGASAQPAAGMNMGGAMPMNGMPQQFGGYMPQMGQMQGMNTPNVQSLQFPSLQSGPGITEQGNIGLIMDVYMEMTVELGRTKKQIKEILGMGEGTIIELDKLAGEPVDILVNHKPIAKGEVVVIDENFGVRVTEILSPVERVSDLN